jgi:hypothetical protein
MAVMVPVVDLSSRVSMVRARARDGINHREHREHRVMIFRVGAGAFEGRGVFVFEHV